MADEAVASAIAFFDACEDAPFLLEVLRDIRPRAAAAVRRYERQHREAPPPREIAPAAAPATRDEALRAVRTSDDFAGLQAIARAVGRRIEALNPPI